MTFTFPSLKRLCDYVKPQVIAGKQVQQLLPGPPSSFPLIPFYLEPIRSRVIQDSFSGMAPLVPGPSFHHPCLDCQQHLPSDQNLQTPQFYLFPKCEPPGFSVHGILQARILERVAISFSRGIFPSQGSNPGFLHCRQILYYLSHKIHITSLWDTDSSSSAWLAFIPPPH